MDAIFVKLAKSAFPGVAFICLAMAWTHWAGADVIYLNDGNRLYGRLGGSSQNHIFFQQRMADGQYRERTLGRDSVAAMVRTIDADRLSALDPQKPADYFEYAEELSVAKDDPEACDLAIRLYLLSAHLDAARFAESAFLAMIKIARNPDEEIRIRALAYQTLPDTDHQWLAPPAKSLASELSDQDLESLLKGVRLLRKGNRSAAHRLINKPSSRQGMKRFKPICSWNQLRGWVTDEKLSHADLAKLLRLEIALSGGWRSTTGEPVAEKWSTLIGISDQPIHVVAFDNLLEIDPSKSLYRNGNWISPPP